MIKQTVALALSLAAFTLPVSAFAATQITSVSTGQGPTGTADASWNIGVVDARIPVAVNDAWIGTTANSGTLGAKWITPLADGNATIATGSVTFSRLFSLPAMADLSTAILSGKIWSDNGVLALRLNGFQFFTNPNPVAQSSAETFRDSFAGFDFSTAFNNANFNNGAIFKSTDNLFEVVISQGTGPAGLLVAGNVETMNAVPEPGTWMLMLLGFGAIGFAMRSRAKTQVRFQFA